MKRTRVVNNTVMLYLMSIAKLIFPLLTMPYLTRILSEDGYGFVAYVRSCMTYMQLIVDFGFILSSVKDIVNADGDKDKIGVIAGNTVVSKLFLCIASGSLLAVMCAYIDALRINITFVVLSFASVVLSSFLLDFLFRGIEKMHYITWIYVVSKGVSTVLTFVLVRGDESILWIPILDVIATIVAVLMSLAIASRLEIRIRVSGASDCLALIKDSFVYFLSNVATTAFSALNTLLIGIYITDIGEVAHFSVCLSIISAIQGLYAPISSSIYPHMIKEKSLSFIHKVLAIFMPIVAVGCLISFFASKLALYVVGGEGYVEAYPILRCMIPILFFSFPAQIYGWPTLGAIGKVRLTTATTVISAAVQVAGLFLLISFDRFDLVSIAILRSITEAVLMGTRIWATYKNKDKFKEQEKKK